MNRWRLFVSFAFGILATMCGIYMGQHPDNMVMILAGVSSMMFILLCMSFAQDDGSYKGKDRN